MEKYYPSKKSIQKQAVILFCNIFVPILLSNINRFLDGKFLNIPSMALLGFFALVCLLMLRGKSPLRYTLSGDVLTLGAHNAKRKMVKDKTVTKDQCIEIFRSTKSDLLKLFTQGRSMYSIRIKDYDPVRLAQFSKSDAYELAQD